MPFFLQLKHWQLFLVLVVFPIACMLLFQLALFSEVFDMAINSAHSPMNSSFQGFPTLFKWFPLLLVIVLIPMFAWQWSFGTTLHKYIPNPRSMKLGRFKAFLIIPFAYFILFSIWMVYLFQSFENMANPPEPMGIPTEFLTMMLSFIIIIPLHLFSMFCMIYTMRFCAKALVSAERGQEAHFSDYIGEFFLIWIQFVGLWFIQPRIQAVLSSRLPTSVQPFNSFDNSPMTARRVKPKAPSETGTTNEKPLNFTPDGDPFEHDDDFDGIL